MIKVHLDFENITNLENFVRRMGWSRRTLGEQRKRKAKSTLEAEAMHPRRMEKRVWGKFHALPVTFHA